MNDVVLYNLDGALGRSYFHLGLDIEFADVMSRPKHDLEYVSDRGTGGYVSFC